MVLHPKIVWLSAGIVASVGCYYVIPSIGNELGKSLCSNNYGCRAPPRRSRSPVAGVEHRYFPTCPYGQPGRKWKTLAPAKGFTKS